MKTSVQPVLCGAGRAPAARFVTSLACGLLLLATARGAPDYTFATLAGVVGTSGTNDGAGLAALFNLPGGVAVDSTGTVYVADSANHTIRAITPAGVVSTWAGSAGVSGTNDGPVAAALFRSPQGLALDGSGNLLVADKGNCTIRRITPAGGVTTVAGTAGTTGTNDGAGLSAKFFYPSAVAADGAGNLYVADTGNHTIRKITPAGAVTTLAGKPGASGRTDGPGNLARFSSPFGIVADSAGNLWVADKDNNLIRKVDPAGNVSTFAGAADAGSLDGHGTAASFSQPYGLARDGAGNLYVADGGNFRIRRISPAADVKTPAGATNIVGGVAPQAVAVDTTGNVFMADTGNQVIRRGGLTGGALLIVQANVALGGTVSGSGLYAPGSNVLITATVSNAWVFSSWNDGNVNPSRTVSVPAGGATYTAHFSPLGTVTVLATPAGGGSVKGGGQFVMGSNALVTATATAGWRFLYWNGSATNNPWLFTVASSSMTCTATFAQQSTVTVRASPAYAGTVGGGGTLQVGSTANLSATAAPGWRFTAWNDGNTNASRALAVPAINSTYTASFTMGLGAAADATNLTWSTGGNASWAVQSVTTHDHVAAVKSGTVGAGQQTWCQATTTGPGSLLFWWKVSAATNSPLQFFVGTQLVSQISGNVDWNQYVGYIGTSNQVTLTWVYNKGSAAGSDAGWVDQVTWMPCDYVTNAPQIFYQDPTGTLASWVLSSGGGMRFARLLANTGSLALKAVGDIDGDGVGDLLFQTANGATTVWFMNADGSLRSTRALWALGGLAVKACGDYEGTGHAQVFFQDAAGNASYWRLDTNGNNLGSVSLGAMGGWMLRGLGDLDGDHKAELFWQNAAGQVVVWYHNPNGTIRSVLAFNTGGWLLSGVVDIDADGVSDLLWQDGVGNTGGWFMNSNGTARAASYWWNTGGWKLKAAGR